MDPRGHAGGRSKSAGETRYVLVTAAYNEERHIEDTLQSVTCQSLPPCKWVIISDGSADGTDDIVRRWATRNPMIGFLRVEKATKHDFASKVQALRRGFAAVEHLDYDFIGVLDADLRFDADYFERLLEHFTHDPGLGIGGGGVVELIDGAIFTRVKDLNSVAGAVQLMRRECFVQTGGLPALKHGGEDAAVEIAARMHGWRTRTFPELEVVHHGLVGAAAGGPLRSRFQRGRRNFGLGYHPLFQIARSIYRAQERPYVGGGLAELAGFVAAWVQERRPSIDGPVARQLRREQIAKLRNPLRG